MTCLDDAMVLGLIEGRLAPPVLSTVDEHLDTCATCRDVVTQVARSISPASRTFERGEALGRYVIGDLVGAGAMGRVYSAWEPELDRRVALKLLTATDPDARDRVLREAKAMAKLDHPNVVGVHEVGTAADTVYVAMELVEGDTLRAWASSPHPWRETAALLVDIARGLAAVHDAGVIHRDVKPDNIIVGRDRRARIGDFGLARAGTSSSSPPLDASLALGTPSTALAGTPAYMAPEVADGASATPASDQFSFGVTAYEALSGTRPFTAATFAQLRESYRSSSVPPLRDVPSWLDAAIRRCLSIAPSSRFPSLTDVAELVSENLQPRHRPRLLVGGIAAAAVLASGATYLALREPAAGPTCSAGTTEIAAMWNATTRTQLAHLGEPALRALDAWTSAWAKERDTTCRAAEYESPAATTARNRCLDRRRDEAAALVGALSRETPSGSPGSSASPSASIVSAPNGSPTSRASNYSLIDTLAALPAPDECAAAASDPADPIPIDKTRAALVLDVQRQLASLRATLALGDARPILDATAALVDTARTAQHAPTLAEAELLHADALRATSQLDAAVDAVRSAAANAERGHADQLAARTWLARVAIAGDRRDLASADDLLAIASGAVDRAGAPRRLVATLLKHRGLVAYNRGQLDEARALLVQAHDLLAGASSRSTTGASTAPNPGTNHASPVSTDSSRDLASRVELIAIESALGSVERAAGNLDASETWHQRALDADRALRGDVHPDIARDLHNLAGVARLRGDLALAFERYSRALEIEIATRGATSVEAGLTHNSLGLVALARAKAAAPEVVRTHLDDARAQFTRARDIFAAASHGDLAFAEHNLGLVDAAANDHRSALAHYAKAAELYTRTIGSSADAAERLVEDRALSERALSTRPATTTGVATTKAVERTNGVEPIDTTIPPAPAVPPVPEPPKGEPARKDVGVYGSTQSW